MRPTSQFLGFFNYSDLSEIPEAPGVYAWYAFPIIGAADWREKLNKLSQDEGDDNLRRVLADFTMQFAPPALKVNARHAFRDAWNGYLEASAFSKSSAELREHSDNTKESNQFPGESIRKVFANEQTRRALTAQLIPHASPINSPIYIGSAKKLKSRISTHVSYFSKLMDSLERTGETRDSLIEKLELKERDAAETGDYQATAIIGFAARLFRHRFELEQLRFTYVGFENLDLSDEQKVALSRTLEWLLNTWNKPILGRV